MPVSWLHAHASPPIRLRTLTEILPSGNAPQNEIESLREEVQRYKAVAQIAKKQRSNGIWGGNILGAAASKSLGIKDIGTIFQYRRLVELGLPSTDRMFQLANRVLFRLLSRDDDPKLMFEYEKTAKTSPEFGGWARGAMQEAASAALAHGGLEDDPRVRGAAHRIITALSQFLRSDVSQRPIIKKGARHILDPEAHPPTLHSVAVIAYMPNLQRERGGFIERLRQFLAQPEPKKAYVIQVGKKIVKPVGYLLGDPLHNDSAGRPRDIPLALHWVELLARLNMLNASPTARRALGRLLKDCDKNGVWAAKNLRAFPKSASGLVDFAFPLEVDEKSVDARRADVTFRLAHLAKLAGLELEFV